MEQLSYPWSSRFIEIACKSIKEIHNNFLLWNIGTADQRERFKKLNTGYGAELADENLVCAFITQEAIGSSLFSGDYVLTSEGYEPGTRYWLVNREQNYLIKNAKGKTICCDLKISRYEIKEDKKIESFIPVYIEAKRARRYSALDIPSAQIKENKYLFKEIKSDINRLIKEKEHVENSDTCEFKSIHPYILVWGVYFNENKYNKNNLLPDEFIDKLKQDDVDLVKRELKWIPVSWEEDKKNSKPYANRWIWIFLVECQSIN